MAQLKYSCALGEILHMERRLSSTHHSVLLGDTTDVPNGHHLPCVAVLAHCQQCAAVWGDVQRRQLCGVRCGGWRRVATCVSALGQFDLQYHPGPSRGVTSSIK